METTGRRRLTDYVSIWVIALLVLAGLWAAVIWLASNETTKYDATVTGTSGGKCVVRWIALSGQAHTGDIACLGRPVGGHAKLMATDPEGDTYADQRAVQLLEAGGLLFTVVPAIISIAGRTVGIRRSRAVGARA